MHARIVALLIVMCVTCPARAVTIEMVTVGNVGNAADPATGSLYGAVDYEYRIGKYAVTISQYTEFLNAVDPEGINPYGLFHNGMQITLNVAGISFEAARPVGLKYLVLNNGGYSGNRPVTYVSWFDAARFANWMHNGQGSGSTETGAYTLVSGQTSGTAPVKNPGAQFYIPTEDEWYKAAYYSPVLNSGSGGYYTYATQSNTDPGNTVGSGSNQANYKLGGVYSVTASSVNDPSQNYLTDVGAFINSASYYGTFDQSGNVYQWNDLTGTDGSETTRGIRGGSWGSWDGGTQGGVSSFRRSGGLFAGREREVLGFRLAGLVAVPEPSTWVMAIGGLACIGCVMRRKRRKSLPKGVMSRFLIVALLLGSGITTGNEKPDPKAVEPPLPVFHAQFPARIPLPVRTRIYVKPESVGVDKACPFPAVKEAVCFQCPQCGLKMKTHVLYPHLPHCPKDRWVMNEIEKW